MVRSTMAWWSFIVAVSQARSPYDRSMSSTASRIETARALFAGWSSGDANAPEPYMTPDAVLFDVASGRFEGWPAIRDFFASGLTRTRNLTLIPDEFWENETGLAVHYVMSGDVVLPTSFGPEHVGRRWS